MPDSTAAATEQKIMRYPHWPRFYWALAKEFGAECLHISRSDMLASALTIGFVFLIDRDALDLRTAIQAAIATLVTIAILHAFRVPWLVVKRMDGQESLSDWWGVLGILFFALFVTCIIYTAAWFYTMQPKVELFRKPDSRDIRLAQQQSQLDLLKEPESPNSLRRRTIRTANDVVLFWSRHPVPPQPVQNPSTDEERQRNAAFNSYWRQVDAIYASTYKDRILGIIQEYKAKGVPTGLIEQSAENHSFGASAFTQSGSPVCWQDELCQFRELAFHVDAKDQMIGPAF